LLWERKKKRRLLTEGPVTGSKTNFDLYLKEQLKDPGFSEQFEKAGEAWDIDFRVFQLGTHPIYLSQTWSHRDYPVHSRKNGSG
jgi:hypothetical protein